MSRADEERIRQELLHSREFIAQAELARRCELKHRSTIKRMLERLHSGGFALEWDERKWVRLDRSKYLLDLKLNEDEALAVFIACRLLARHSDRPNPHAVNALAKLGTAMRGGARVIGEHVLATSEQLKRKQNQAAREYVHNLEALTRAWADRVSVYLYTRKKPHHARKFDPYMIEPSLYTNYVIGYDHTRQDFRTFKIQWLKRVSSTAEHFEVRENFDVQQYLGNAWGINWGKGELETVRLRFTGNAAERVQDNVWHDSQKLKQLDNGAWEMTVQVGDTLEMIPFVRQWGHECEVREPEHLRKTIGEHARKMAELYDNVKQEDFLDADKRG